MKKIKAVLYSRDFQAIAVLALVSGLVYLPFVGQFGYFNDDWYLMYSAGAKGASVFHDIFIIYIVNHNDYLNTFGISLL